LSESLVGKTSEYEQLSAQLSLKDTEKVAAVGERDTQIQTLTEANTLNQSELQRLQALELKINAINEMDRPDLVPLLDTIPNMTDAEALKTTLSTFADFADKAADTREQQLTAGVLPTGGGITNAPSQPSTPEAWKERIEKLPVGSADRKAEVARYGEWLRTTNQ